MKETDKLTQALKEEKIRNWQEFPDIMLIWIRF